MPKTVSYIWEKYSSYVIALIISILCFKFLDLSKFSKSDILFDKTVDFSGIIFGFLITVLTILIQTNNAAISLLKKTNRFKDLLGFNKRVIFISALLCFYSVLILIFKEYSFYNYNDAPQYFMTLYIFLFVTLILSTYGFLRIFYQVIRDGPVAE